MTQIATQEQDLDQGSLPTDQGDSSDLQRYDGSRTSPDTQYEIMRRHKTGMAISAIAADCHCDPRTVKAVIQNWGTSLHTLRLEAHRSQVVDNVILGMHEAAKRGKLDSLLTLSHTLGITEAPKAQQTSVGVQVILHGGGVPSELSPAKVIETSETLEIQATNSVGLIMPVMSPSNPLDSNNLQPSVSSQPEPGRAE